MPNTNKKSPSAFDGRIVASRLCLIRKQTSVLGQLSSSLGRADSSARRASHRIDANMSTSQYPNLLSRIDVGQFTLRNRVFVSAHVPGFAENNKPGERYVAYHRERAAGGVALQITGGTPVHRSGMLSMASDGLWNLDDSIIPGYKRLAAAVHEEGGRVLAQLAHSGGTVHIDQAGYESWAPTAVRSEMTGAVSHAMSLSEIEEVTNAYADAAGRVVAGDLDGIEVLAAFGYLPQAFLSPRFNHRQDHYGGSLDNRMRFLLEVLEAVRDRVGQSRIVGIRIPGDEFIDGGLDLAAMREIARRVSDTGLIDYINVIAHTNMGHTGRALHWPPTPATHGLFVHLAAGIREVVDVPVFTVGRITDPAQAERIIASGRADMVGMTRAHIADPEIVRKITIDEPERIRPCVGANTCIASRYVGKPVRCMHNPALRSPGVRLPVTATNKRIIVIGAGAAGLEAARFAAECGYSVRVFEARDVAGGQLMLWSRAPSMKELGAIIDWRLRELDRLDVPISYNHALTEQDLSRLDADHVVMATGAEPILEPTIGDGSVPVRTVHDILLGIQSSGARAIVWSDGRGQAGLAAAEVLVATGSTVEIVTSDIAVAADLDPTNRTAWYQRLGKQDVQFTARMVVDDVCDGVVNLRDVYTGQPEKRKGIDLIVDWRGQRSVDGLWRVIRGQPTDIRVQYHRIGDCIAPRGVEIATADAHQLITSLANA